MPREFASLQWWVVQVAPYDETFGRWKALADEWAKTDDVRYVAPLQLRGFLRRGLSRGKERPERRDGWERGGAGLWHRTVLGGYLPSLTRMHTVPGLWRANEAVLSGTLRNLLRKERRPGVRQVLVNFDWKLSWAVRDAGADYLVYDCSDLFRAYPRESAARVDWSERRTASFSDLVVVSSECFSKRLSDVARGVVFIPNGTPFSEGTVSAGDPRPTGSRPVVGYHGGTESWRFDWSLLAETARLCPEIDFHVFSHGYDTALSIPANVRLFGWLPPEEVAQRIRGFSAGFMPYRRTEPTLSGFPSKLFEYFSFGVPVVSARLPELERFREHLDLVDDAGEAARSLRAAIRPGDRDAGERRIALARAFSWKALATRYRREVVARMGEGT